MNVERIVDQEIATRQAFEKKILEIVLAGYDMGSGHVRRGDLQTYVYNQLGFKGRSGNDFARFVNKVLVENGFRVSFSRGKRVYFGLKKRLMGEPSGQTNIP